MSAKRYRKKPVEVEAWQWASSLPESLAREIAAWCGGTYRPDRYGALGPDGESWGWFSIDTLEGVMTVAPYDYVIRGIAGEFYPCKPDIFEATYEPMTS